MEIGRARLNAAERQRRLQENRCLYCGELGHFKSNCPASRRSPLTTRVSYVSPAIERGRFSLITTVSWSSHCITLPALIDSGAAGNFIDKALAHDLQIPLLPCKVPVQIKGIDNRPVGSGHVTEHTVPLVLKVGVLHTETISLFVIDAPSCPLVLGFPWLAMHNPVFSWSHSELTQWSKRCHAQCMSLPCLTTSIESPEIDTPLTVPSEYSDLAEVFSKSKAASLPPHRPWDCAINLLLGTTPPRGRIYPLSIPESLAMETYIKEAPDLGYICPSTSPAAAGFFFVKKDGGLRPCIDYRGLNAITVKKRLPMPLVTSAIEQVREAKIFTKLDLRSAYNLVRIREGDEWKTAFVTNTGHYEYLVMSYGLVNAPSVFQAFVNEVLRDMLNKFVVVYLDDILVYSSNYADHVSHVRQVLRCLLHHRLFVKLEKCEFHKSTLSYLGYILSPQGVQMDDSKIQAVLKWPQPHTVKELQRFLGFANFYRRFIQNYSIVTVPLTSLLRGNPKRLKWSPAALSAFSGLKGRFTSAPILRHPDPSQPFVVEVDASETGLGAVLSQALGKPSRLHPCAFYSRKLTLAEQNYDVGNRELLAVKAALEEWRHWLEGALHPFTILTDHRNLEYVRTARRLNARQARWALFFTRFNFTMTYRPGTKNVKADALSRLYDHPSTREAEKTILPASCIVAPILWAIMDEIQRAQTSEPPPPTCPSDKVYVPTIRPSIMCQLSGRPRRGTPGTLPMLATRGPTHRSSEAFTPAPSHLLLIPINYPSL
ncbi:hypothetical protein NFI96_008578 [Prochilodus magdalenae]|nr:hypothetical protein NFI96_008578 [Prochilodus magdalenae]